MPSDDRAGVARVCYACAMVSYVWTSVALCGLYSLAACSDDATCGPPPAAISTITTAGAAELTYGDFTVSANNDCPDAAAPAGVVSLTIAGTQASTSAPITFCLPRPDLAETGRALALGSELQVIDVTGTDANGCAVSLVRPVMATGTAQALGMCEKGAAQVGFALQLDGTVRAQRTCIGQAAVGVDLTLRGTVALRAE